MKILYLGIGCEVSATGLNWTGTLSFEQVALCDRSLLRDICKNKMKLIPNGPTDSKYTKVGLCVLIKRFIRG